MVHQAEPADILAVVQDNMVPVEAAAVVQVELF
jgi:hypothetical protein